MALESYRAFACDGCDYYELQEDLGEVLSKGAIFVHDKNDSDRGSVSAGCLLLCWTPEGNCYGGSANCGLCGETVIFHADFAKSSLFKLVAGPSVNAINRNKLNRIKTKLGDLLEEFNKLCSEI